MCSNGHCFGASCPRPHSEAAFSPFFAGLGRLLRTLHDSLTEQSGVFGESEASRESHRTDLSQLP